MPNEFKPIETDVKNALTRAAADIEKGYPGHLKDISERAEKVVANGSKTADEANAADIRKILDGLDSDSARTAGAKAAEHGGRASKLGAILDPDGEAQRVRDHLRARLDTLSAREAKVLSMRFGLTDGQPRTLEETAHAFGVTRERIRQIEAEAIAKLR